MAQQSAYESLFYFLPIDHEPVRSEQIGKDIVFIHRIKRDLLSPAGITNGPDGIQGLVPVKGGDLDRMNLGDLRKFTPERIAQ